MTKGSKVICLRLPEYGTGAIIDISRTGLLDIEFEDGYRDWFHPLEVDLLSKRPTLTLGTAA